MYGELDGERGWQWHDASHVYVYAVKADGRSTRHVAAATCAACVCTLRLASI